jgi:hypothetical protein
MQCRVDYHKAGGTPTKSIEARMKKLIRSGSFDTVIHEQVAREVSLQLRRPEASWCIVDARMQCVGSSPDRVQINQPCPDCPWVYDPSDGAFHKIPKSPNVPKPQFGTKRTKIEQVTEPEASFVSSIPVVAPVVEPRYQR